MARSFELGDLRHDVRASINSHAFDAFEMLGKQIDLLGDLLAQLTSRSQDQGLDAIIRRIEVVQEWKAKCRCFSRSCLSEPNEISITLQEVRDRLALNVGRGVKTKLTDGFEDRGGKA
jgi:hypothetical protein